MLGKHIQLPFGIVRDKSKEKSIKLNLPLNFKKDVLFNQLPYLNHLENPAIVDVVKKWYCRQFKSAKIYFSNQAFKRQYSA